MIGHKPQSPHLDRALAREFAGQNVTVIGRYEFSDYDTYARWAWLIAIPGTAYMLYHDWALAEKFLQSRFSGADFAFRLFQLLFDIIDAFWNIALTSAALALLLLPWILQRYVGDVAHVVTDRHLVKLSAQANGTVKVSQMPISSIVAIERVEGTSGAGALTIRAELRRTQKGDTIPREMMLYGIDDPQRAETLLRTRMGDKRNSEW
jgi:hypothetical protein